jgi:hypothetical protein
VRVLLRGLGVTAVAAAGLAFALEGCTGLPVVGAGQPCFRASDCAENLVCVPENPAVPDGGRICSDDLTGLGTAAVPDGGDAAAMDAARADAPVDAPPPDTGVLDTGAPDTGAPDTGTPDAGGNDGGAG